MSEGAEVQHLRLPLFFREVVLFLRAVNDDVDNNLKVVFCMYLTDVIKGCFLNPILGEKPVGPIRHKWGRCSSLPTVLCESSYFLNCSAVG